MATEATHKVTREIGIESLGSGLSAEMKEGRLTMRGPKGSVSRAMVSPFVAVSVDRGKIILVARSQNRKAKATLETIQAHIANMAEGVLNGFEYRLEVVQSHFPIKVTAAGSEVRIENFIGEKSPRVVKIEPGVKAKVGGKSLTLSGSDVEALGKSAQKIEDATKIKRKDHRTFQDGVYIIDKKVRPKGVEGA